VENNLEYPLMEPVHHPCMEDYELEGSEVELHRDEEEYYPSCSDENDDHL
jgi:hypothetical protein